jgi:hypothetical protein
MTEDREITFRVGSFRVHFYPVEGGMSVEAFDKRHNGHPQGDWLVASEDDFETPDCKEAIRQAHDYRAFLDMIATNHAIDAERMAEAARGSK